MKITFSPPSKPRSGTLAVSVLEGGYHLEALAESVEVHLQELATTSTGTDS